ncbi:Arginyl-tRNA--protein transferase 1, partial [Exaiptasia diaphana]
MDVTCCPLYTINFKDFLLILHYNMQKVQGNLQWDMAPFTNNTTWMGNYYPSYLVCPVTYNWVPIEDCTPRLDVNKYSRLDDNSPVPASTDINKVMVLYKGQSMPFLVLNT